MYFLTHKYYYEFGVSIVLRHLSSDVVCSTAPFSFLNELSQCCICRSFDDRFLRYQHVQNNSEEERMAPRASVSRNSSLLTDDIDDIIVEWDAENHIFVEEEEVLESDEDLITSTIVRDALRRSMIKIGLINFRDALNSGIESFLKERHPTSYHLPPSLHFLKRDLAHDPRRLFPTASEPGRALDWARQGYKATEEELRDIRGDRLIITYFSAFLVVLGPTVCNRPDHVSSILEFMDAFNLKPLENLPPFRRCSI